MILNRRLKPLLLLSLPEPFSRTQILNYVNVKQKLKKDPFFDSIEVLTQSKDLRPLLTIKDILSKEPNKQIPISSISKRAREFEISGRVAGFLRRYPSFFEEFVGPKYNLPWFKLTQDALELDELEKSVYNERKVEVVDRLRRLILISREKMLPFRIVQGMLWYLGLPDDFLANPDGSFDGVLEVVEIGNGEKGLRAAFDPNERIYSAIQRKSIDAKFLLFPSKGLRLKRKVQIWMERFQSVPYISPYEDCSGLDPSSDASEKRVVGVLHELLSLFADASAERRRILCLRKHLALPQKFYKCFERHPHVFYRLLKNKTCYVVLKEAYCGGSDGGERHPMLEVREKYARLMSKSDAILRRRRCGKHLQEEVLGSENGEGFYDEVANEGIRNF